MAKKKKATWSLRVAQLWMLGLGVLSGAMICACIVGVLGIIMGVLGLMIYELYLLMIFMGVWNTYASAILAIIIFIGVLIYMVKISIWANRTAGNIF